LLACQGEVEIRVGHFLVTRDLRSGQAIWLDANGDRDDGALDGLKPEPPMTAPARHLISLADVGDQDLRHIVARGAEFARPTSGRSPARIGCRW
jgi:hypothetical protein